MKKIIRVIFLFTLFLLSIGIRQAKATHVMGMDVSWKSLGNDTFEIKLVVYRRCTDGASPLSVPATPMTITSDSCGSAINIAIGTPLNYTIEDITPLCPSAPKLCPISGGSGIGTPQVPMGVERHTVYYKIFLGGAYAQCCWYKMRWQLCCRNSNISTGYADMDFYSESWLNRCVKNGDDGPTFANPPLIMAAVGQDVCYNHAVMEPDGDSLTYELAPPLGGAYISPWSALYPLTCLGGNNPNPNANIPSGFNLDTHTGDIRFRPVQTQITVLKIMVTEWRKDSIGIYRIIGKTARDMQFSILPNNGNKTPVIVGPYSYDAYAGQQICFTVNTTDSDALDTTRIVWNKGIPMGTWTENNNTVKKASGTFCWTPLQSDIRDLPYYFTVFATDDHCAVPAIASRSFTIRVRPLPKSGINGNGWSDKIKISPNPFYNQLKININNFEKPVSIILYDMQGKSVLKQTATSSMAELNTINISSGLYLLEIIDGENKTIYKVEKR